MLNIPSSLNSRASSTSSLDLENVPTAELTDTSFSRPTSLPTSAQSASAPNSPPTPSMPRSQLVSLQRTSAHDAIVSQIEFSLFYETAILAYLTACLVLASPSTPAVPTCNMHATYNTATFLFWVIWPCVCVRAIGYCIYRNTTFNKLRNLCLLLNVQWNLCFGVWTYVNLWKLVQM